MSEGVREVVSSLGDEYFRVAKNKAKNKHNKDEKKECGRQGTKGRRLTGVLICLAMLTTICAVLLAVRVVSHEADLAAMQREYEALPELPDTSQPEWTTLKLHNERMREINPDYAGLLRLEGTTVSYPLVRGNDNVKYLTTSFEGAETPFGSLFMDYRCVGKNLPHIIVYGHHYGDSSGNRYLLGSLDAFFDEGYTAEHRVITYIDDDCLYEYIIFSVRVSDINDPAYNLNFSEPGSFETFLENIGAPPDSIQIFTLSTCVGSGGDDSRIIIQGTLNSVLQMDENQSRIAIPYGT